MPFFVTYYLTMHFLKKKIIITTSDYDLSHRHGISIRYTSFMKEV